MFNNKFKSLSTMRKGGSMSKILTMRPLINEGFVARF